MEELLCLFVSKHTYIYMITTYWQVALRIFRYIMFPTLNASDVSILSAQHGEEPLSADLCCSGIYIFYISYHIIYFHYEYHSHIVFFCTYHSMLGFKL